MAVKKELGEIDFELTYSPNVKQRKIILIPKSNTSHKSIKSLRPISLLSSYYKIISNILAAQLKGALLDDNIMPKHMLAYLPRISGQEAIRLLLDSIDNARIRNADLFLLQADLESAFDSLSKPYLLSVLEKLNLPSIFLDRVLDCLILMWPISFLMDTLWGT